VRHLRHIRATGYLVSARGTRVARVDSLAARAPFRMPIPRPGLRREGGSPGAAPPPLLEVCSFQFGNADERS
jgi:hypothetical protein